MHDVTQVLPFVHADGEEEVQRVFEEVLPIHLEGGAAASVADRYFYESVVRIHRTGEGAVFTGLKPAGLDVGPVIPLAEAAIATGDPSEVIEFLVQEVEDLIRAKFVRLSILSDKRDGSLESERAYVEASLDFQVTSHHLHMNISKEMEPVGQALADAHF